MTPDEVIVWGGTGQARVVHSILQHLHLDVASVCDRRPSVRSPFPGVPVLHTEAEFRDWLATRDVGRLRFVAAIGGCNGRSRLDVHRYLADLRIAPLSVVHPAAWVDSSATVGLGSQVLAMSAVSVAAELGRQCIVNTHATVDHESRLGDGVHVMPGATVTGEVVIEDCATIGSNATVLPRLTIGRGAIVGAGAVVTRDVAPGVTVAGVPARLLRETSPARDSYRNPWLA